jgi:cyclopropane fatty-acyl-phospholipid synthase-like methyltransferase
MGWQDLWQDPQVRERWEAIPPLPEVVEMADRLEREGRRRVLDIGCGLGRHTVYLAARGFEVTATDVASSAIEKCTQNLENAGLRATMVELDMTQFPWPDGHFGGVVASNVIHHADLATLKGIIGSITRTLAPSGYFVWVTPTPRHYACGRGREMEPMTWIDSEEMDGHLPHHYSTEQEVRELLLDYDRLSMYEHEYREGENSRWHWRILARKRSEQ